MQENIVTYLREHPDGVPSQVLAELFLKFKNPEPTMAHCAIAAILKNDKRCKTNKQHEWFAEIKQNISFPLRNKLFTAVYCLIDSSNKPHKLSFISILDIFENQSTIFNTWLTKTIPSSQDLFPAEFNLDINCEQCSTIEEPIGKLYQILQSRIPVFLSYSEYSIVKRTLSQYGYCLTDDFILLPELFKAAGIPIIKPVSFESVCQTLNHQIIPPTDIRKAPQHFACILREMFESLLEKGIESREMLDNLLNNFSVDWFKDKEYDLNTIQALPSGAGVYGFKDKNDTFIYIGKAKNLNRRLSGYFRSTDESPDKLNQLRANSHKLITYQCGSELEAIIYEYRLIRKHRPVLNSQIDINERPGHYKPVPDIIIVLPHALNTRLMLFMLRQNQKIIMKQIEFPTYDKASLHKDIEEYFFKGVLKAEPTDFPEIELATRWIKNNRDELNFIDVYNHSDAQATTDVLTDLIRSLCL
ncbi:MAG: nucleotide excision repair endonuclease [Chitinispirillaceae bacterium]|nr:nucleotide excision repair endonuclease [Chitinispirillaceae bacterium]